MKNLFFLIPFFFLIGKTFSQQNFNTESSKYWFYRDRLKYFVMPGSEPGQSIIFTHRNDNYPAERIAITQPRVVDGFYIGMLATEYKLLKDNEQILKIK